MVKPSPQLCARLRFTTKQVAKGFYRGNRAGAMGAHTEYGRYVIDWRKTAHYNMPEIKDFPLTPFVTMEMEPKSRATDRPDGTTYVPDKVDAVEFLRIWKKTNPLEYDGIVAHQEEERRRFAAATTEEYHGQEAQEQAQQEAQQWARDQAQQRTEKQVQKQVQQQTRSFHTTRRLRVHAQPPVVEAQSDQPAKDWSEMSRADRKALVNPTATSELRRLRKERKGKLTQQEKKETKKDIKVRLRRELVGEGVFQNEKELQKLLTEEGRRRKAAGLPRRTHGEKAQFLEELQREAESRT
ncbi:uncharacterized protein Z520_06432 [Fonsecaea multimorphosa CBS 102226]|uniref:Uncharacterized protein n=1 Tax=Fonsecaea multimorphosa CBS 102226 TaxID=1442371 RepID=A0A0D2K3C6_9EURO|nr:uncharacterized protein Z520_06432 [Fonsecaea multimorphosa CBS 102226]KIX97654.1 hypothetical protein Z520_06432 [Fonsecaea multimorphosa CBS 102226]OAL23973.1 hypothetical protein AYO22_05997 [Fonsecaea multimorphosa]